MGRERHPIPCVGSGNDPWAFSSTESWPKPGTGSMKPVKPWRNLAFEIITGIEDCNPSFGVEHGSSFEEMESVGMWQPKHGDTTATQLVVILGQTELIYWFTVSEVRLPLHVVELRPTMQHVSHFAFHSSKNKYWQHVLLFLLQIVQWNHSESFTDEGVMAWSVAPWGVQGDAYAPPSWIRVRVPMSSAPWSLMERLTHWFNSGCLKFQ